MMLLEPRKPRELVANFDYSMSVGGELACPFAHFEGDTYSLGSKKKPYSPSYTTGTSLYSAASRDVSWICAKTQAFDHYSISGQFN